MFAGAVMRADISVRLRWYQPSEGGRQSIPVGLDYRATARIGDDDSYWSVKLFMPDSSWAWDEQRDIDTLFLVREELEQLLKKGAPIYITEGQRIVAEGSIVEVFPQRKSLDEV
jgi:hypothetical protein